MNTTRKLRLGPLPKVESVKLAFACPVSLKADLDRYAALHAQVYGEAVDATTLIPHMLEAFMAADRGFRKGGRGKAAPPKSGGRSERIQHPLTMKAQPTGCAFIVLGVGQLGYYGNASRSAVGKRARCNALRLSLLLLLCGT